MADVGVQQALRGGLRPNYSSNSLAAAEQLEALVRHASGGGPEMGGQDLLFDAALGEPNSGMSAPPVASMPTSMAPPLHQHYAPPSCHRGINPFALAGIPGAGSCSSQGMERMDFPTSSLQMQLHPFRDAVAMNAVLRQADGAGMLGTMHQGMGGHGQGGGSMNLLLGGPPGGLCGHGHGVGMGLLSSVEHTNEYQQKRRFVWTPDLHARFESACNQLGLDNAKPKSILRLMNVEGLTKANIKSHLQKYRCMMQKRSAADMGVDSDSQPPAKAQKRTPASKTSGGDESSDGNSNAGDVACMSSLAASLSRESASTPAAGGEGKEGAGSGPLALHQNLEVQEETLLAQMELQQQLSKQLQIQKRLQSEMEAMMQARAGGAEDASSSSKMNAILQMKQKLQNELQCHMRMQHDLLTQLSQVVLPLSKTAESSSEEGSAAYGVIKDDVESLMNGDGESDDQDDGKDDADESEDGPDPMEQKEGGVD